MDIVHGELVVTFPDTEPSEEDRPEVEEAKDADGMDLLSENENEDYQFKSFDLAFACLHTFVGLGPYYVNGSGFAYKILTWCLLVCMPLCILLCYGSVFACILCTVGEGLSQ